MTNWKHSWSPNESDHSTEPPQLYHSHQQLSGEFPAATKPSNGATNSQEREKTNGSRIESNLRTNENCDSSKENEKMNTESTEWNKRSFLENFSSFVSLKLEDFFALEGEFVATHPKKIIATTIFLTALSSVGFIWFKEENRSYKLFIPEGSRLDLDIHWIFSTFPENYRRHVIFIEGENVLSANGIQHMWKIHKQIAKNRSPLNSTWEDVCVRVPDMTSLAKGRLRIIENDTRTLEEKIADDINNDVSTTFSRQTYCSRYDDIDSLCLERSLLEVWGYDEEVIMSLSDEKVVHDVNKAAVSAVFGFPTKFDQFLGSISRDSSGRMTSAKLAQMFLFTHVNKDEVANNRISIDQSSGAPIDSLGYEFERTLVDRLLRFSKESDDFETLPLARMSIGHEAIKTIYDNSYLAVFGFLVMFCYIQITIGQWGLIEMRPVPTIAGLAAVAFAFGISVGVCSLLRLSYGIMNSVVPIVLVALGVDDMFVIIAAWERVGRPLDDTMPKRIGAAMRHAGVAITVTSLTDVTAFAIGASSQLPGLRSFCLYAAVGIFVVYIFQATFFVAWLNLDQVRLENERNCLFWWIKHEGYKAPECYNRNFCQLAFNKLAVLLMKPYIRAFTVIFALAILGVNLWGLTNIEQRFESSWLVSDSSYVSKFYKTEKKHFPDEGTVLLHYFQDVNLPEELPVLLELTETLRNSNFIQAQTVSAWVDKFPQYLAAHPKYFWLDYRNMTYDEFAEALSLYLHSPTGAEYQYQFVFNNDLKCLENAPTFEKFLFLAKFVRLEKSKDQIEGMDSLIEIVQNANLTGKRSVWGIHFADYELNRVVIYELARNMGLVSMVVFIMTVIMLASLRGSLMILFSVTSTLVSVIGLMYYWGMYIDTVSCISLVLGIGLSVDFASHVTHAFLNTAGTRTERAKTSLCRIGPPVFHGGMSTLCAFLVISGSDFHIFITFCKIFVGISIFGLFNGLIMIPVVLSLIGPPPYTHKELESSEDDCLQKENISNNANPKPKNLQSPEVVYCSKSHNSYDGPAQIYLSEEG